MVASNGTFYEKSDTACLLNVFHINQPINFEIYINPLTALHSQINVWKPDIFSRMCMQITLYEFLDKSLWKKEQSQVLRVSTKLAFLCGILLIKEVNPQSFFVNCSENNNYYYNGGSYFHTSKDNNHYYSTRYGFSDNVTMQSEIYTKNIQMPRPNAREIPYLPL